MGLYQGGAQEDDSLTALNRARMSPGGASPLGGGGTSPVAPPQPLMPQQRPTSPTQAPGGAPSGGAGSPAGAPSAGGPPGTTFAMLQASGIARPAPPTPTPVTPSPAPAPAANGSELAGNPGVSPFGGGQVNETTGAGGEPLKPQDDPTDPGGGGQGGPPGGGGGGTGTGGTGDTGGGGTPPATPGNTKYPLQDDIEAQIKKLLGMGSPYDDAAFQNDVGREYNKIDDQYTLGQKDLGDNLARRGLGAAGDSTIGLGRMSDLNVGRKSAKETVLSDLASQRARTQMDDLSRVLGIATQYGQGSQALTLEQQQQQFNTQMQIAQLLAQLGYKTPGR